MVWQHMHPHADRPCLQVAMDMKAQGMYVCRTLSFEGEHSSRSASSLTEAAP